MIKYTLECRKKHRFESWFKSADAFEKLLTSGHVTCSVCGISEVSKSIMAPNIGAKSNSRTKSQDLNKRGACGNAKQASSKKGHITLNFVCDKLIKVFKEIEEIPLKYISNKTEY